MVSSVVCVVQCTSECDGGVPIDHLGLSDHQCIRVAQQHNISCERKKEREKSSHPRQTRTFNLHNIKIQKAQLCGVKHAQNLRKTTKVVFIDMPEAAGELSTSACGKYKGHESVLTVWCCHPRREELLRIRLERIGCFDYTTRPI